MINLLKEFFEAFGFFIIVGGMSLIPVSIIILFNYKKIITCLLNKAIQRFINQIH